MTTRRPQWARRAHKRAHAGTLPRRCSGAKRALRLNALGPRWRRPAVAATDGRAQLLQDPRRRALSNRRAGARVRLQRVRPAHAPAADQERARAGAPRAPRRRRRRRVRSWGSYRRPTTATACPRGRRDRTRAAVQAAAAAGRRRRRRWARRAALHARRAAASGRLRCGGPGAPLRRVRGPPCRRPRERAALSAAVLLPTAADELRSARRSAVATAHRHLRTAKRRGVRARAHTPHRAPGRSAQRMPAQRAAPNRQLAARSTVTVRHALTRMAAVASLSRVAAQSRFVSATAAATLSSRAASARDTIRRIAASDAVSASVSRAISPRCAALCGGGAARGGSRTSVAAERRTRQTPARGMHHFAQCPVLRHDTVQAPRDISRDQLALPWGCECTSNHATDCKAPQPPPVHASRVQAPSPTRGAPHRSRSPERVQGTMT